MNWILIKGLLLAGLNALAALSVLADCHIAVYGLVGNALFKEGSKSGNRGAGCLLVLFFPP